MPVAPTAPPPPRVEALPIIATQEADMPVTSCMRSRLHQQAPTNAQPPRVPLPVLTTEPIYRCTRSINARQGLKACLLQTFGLLAFADTSLSVGQQMQVHPCQAPPVPLTPTPASLKYIALPWSAVRQYLSHFLHHLAFPITDEETDSSLEYSQLWKHPWLATICTFSYSNEMG